MERLSEQNTMGDIGSPAPQFVTPQLANGL
jgi:hypothetical protein